MQRGEPDGAHGGAADGRSYVCGLLDPDGSSPASHGWLLRRPLPPWSLRLRSRLGAGLRTGVARPRGLVVCLRLFAGRPGATRRLRDARVGAVGVTSAARTAVGQEASARRWIRKLAGPRGALRNCARRSRRGVLGTESAQLCDTLVTDCAQARALFWATLPRVGCLIAVPGKRGRYGGVGAQGGPLRSALCGGEGPQAARCADLGHRAPKQDHPTGFSGDGRPGCRLGRLEAERV